MNKKTPCDFRVALFDLDGTLIDTESQYSVFWNRMQRQFFPDEPDFANRIKGTTLTDILDRYFKEEPLRHEMAGMITQWEKSMRYDFFPGAREFVSEIRSQGVKCAVVTSSNEVKMRSVRDYNPDFDQLFDRVLTAEMFPKSKPDPSCFLLGAQVFDAPIEHCVVFEDAVNGLKAGQNSGMLTIGFITTNPEETVKQYCDVAVHTFKELDYLKVCQLLERKNSGESLLY